MTPSQPMPKRLARAYLPLRGIARDLKRTLRRLARSRGGPYLIAWAHRITGILLALYILYEVFGNRRDDTLIKWACALSAIYVLLLGLVMIIGSQAVSAAFFWLYTAAAAAGVTYIALCRIRRSGAGTAWKLQRITGAYLLLMVPAHLLFMHLNPSLGHDARVIIERLRNPLMKLVDLTLVLSVLYHGAYGIWTIGQDYLPPGSLRKAFGALVLGLVAWLSWIGMRLAIAI